MSQGNKGYIRLHRQIQDCWVWDDKFSKGQAWVDLLLSANHRDKKMPFNDEIVTIERGQYLTSMRKLADRWGWNRSTVSRFLKLLEKDEMITTNVTTSHTLITIVNYDIYQYVEDESVTPSVPPSIPPTIPEGSHEPTQTINDNKCINEKKDIYNAQFLKFWSIYPRKVDKKKAYKCYQTRLKEGFSEEELMQAAQNYADECKKENRDSKYIKHPSTFLGVDTPFTEYLKKGNENGEKNKATTGRQYTDEELDRFEQLL